MNPRFDVDDELLTVMDFLRWAASEFESGTLYFGHGTDNSWDESVALLCGALHIPWHELQHVLAARLTTAERVALCRMVRERVEDRVPVPYLTGTAWFAGLPFHCDRRALVPRSPIAELLAKEFTPYLPSEPHQILDLCCGGGCIGIAAALQFPQAGVVLSDIDEDALVLAAENIARHDVAERVSRVQSDLFSDMQPQQYDLILANPPYVPRATAAVLPAEYRHEPRHAFVGGEDGLDLVQKILAQASNWLSPHGLLVLEVGEEQEAVEQRWPDLAFVWAELEYGGGGVAMIERAALL